MMTSARPNEKNAGSVRFSLALLLSPHRGRLQDTLMLKDFRPLYEFTGEFATQLSMSKYYNNNFMGTALSGSIFTVLTGLSWICVGIHSRRALPSPVCALNGPIWC